MNSGTILTYVYPSIYGYIVLVSVRRFVCSLSNKECSAARGGGGYVVCLI